jgi:hypothetical protein
VLVNSKQLMPSPTINKPNYCLNVGSHLFSSAPCIGKPIPPLCIASLLVSSLSGFLPYPLTTNVLNVSP